jgi:hypothetical protein
MSIELARELWKETKNFVHDSHDKKEAAEAVTAVLMEYFDAEEIADAFKFDKNVINSVAEYLGDDLDDDYYDEE